MVQSLQQLALRAIIKNVDTLESVGDLPYDFCRPFLIKVQNPDQLHRIEINSPSVVGETGELWRNLCRRDIPGYERFAGEPTNPESWWKFYKYVKRKDKEEQEEQERALREKMEALNKAKSETQTTISNQIVNLSKKKSSNHPVFRLQRRGIKPQKVQLPQHLIAERKAVAKQKETELLQRQTKSGVDLPTRLPASAIRVPSRRIVAGPTTSKSASSSRPRSLHRQERSFDDLFNEVDDDVLDKETTPPPPAPVAQNRVPLRKPVSQISARSPPPKASVSVPNSLKKRKREVNLFMPPKKR